MLKSPVIYALVFVHLVVHLSFINKQVISDLERALGQILKVAFAQLCNQLKGCNFNMV